MSQDIDPTRVNKIEKASHELLCEVGAIAFNRVREAVALDSVLKRGDRMLGWEHRFTAPFLLADENGRMPQALYISPSIAMKGSNRLAVVVYKNHGDGAADMIEYYVIDTVPNSGELLTVRKAVSTAEIGDTIFGLVSPDEDEAGVSDQMFEEDYSLGNLLASVVEARKKQDKFKELFMIDLESQWAAGELSITEAEHLKAMLAEAKSEDTPVIF